VTPPLDCGIPWGYFDGASQDHPPLCGIGIFLHLSHSHVMHIHYVQCRSSNNSAKSIALRTLLSITSLKGIKTL